MPELSLDQKDLLLRISGGDEKAFHLLYELYQEKIFFLSLKLMGSKEKARDLTQEIFLKLWINREKLANVEHFSAYLNTIVRNEAYSRFRARSVEEVFLFDWMEEEKNAEADPLQKVSFSELQIALHEAVQTLSPQQKKVFQLGKLEGLKHEEIAERLSISKETVKKHMMEALRNVKVYLESKGFSLSLYFLFCVLPLFL